MGCTEKEIVEQDIEKDLINRIDDFVEFVKTDRDVISNRSAVEYTLDEAVYLIEAALNRRYSYPWHVHDNISFSESTEVVQPDSRGYLTAQEVLDLYDDMEQFAACHLDDYSGPNKEPRAYDVYVVDNGPTAYSIGVVSVVGSIGNPIVFPDKSFATADNYWWNFGECDGNSTEWVQNIYSDYLTYNVTPLVADVPYNIVNVSIHALGHKPNQLDYGWKDENPNDTDDLIKDYKVWYLNCDDNDSTLPDCDQMYINGTINLNAFGEKVFCHRNTTGLDYELDFYLDNMEPPVIALASALNKTFVSAEVRFDAMDNGEQYEKTQLFYKGIIRLGHKQYPDDPTKDLLTCL